MTFSTRRGMSLLEVILALAIFAGAVAALGELVHIGLQSADRARSLTRAQLLCQSKVAEITASVLPPDPIQGEPVESDPGWLYSTEIEPTDLDGMLALRVTVEQDLPSGRRAIAFSLVQWIPDPDFEPPKPADESADESETGEEEDSTEGDTGAAGDAIAPGGVAPATGGSPPAGRRGFRDGRREPRDGGPDARDGRRDSRDRTDGRGRLDTDRRGDAPSGGTGVSPPPRRQDAPPRRPISVGPGGGNG